MILNTQTLFIVCSDLTPLPGVFYLLVLYDLFMKPEYWYLQELNTCNPLHEGFSAHICLNDRNEYIYEHNTLNNHHSYCTVILSGPCEDPDNHNYY